MMSTEQIVQWKKLAADGILYARFVLGTLYETGNGVPVDPGEAAKWFESATGKTDFCKDTFLGTMYAQGHVLPSDDAEAITWIEEDATKGFAEAQFILGWRFGNGYGVDKDDFKAVEWYRKAAEQGHAGAQNNLGTSYYNGTGVEKDQTETVKWIQKAAEQGHTTAQHNLGCCYFDGKGVEKDDKKAAKWFMKAAEQGHIQSQYYRGLSCKYGWGVEKNESAAAKWFWKSALLGNTLALDQLEVDPTQRKLIEAIRRYGRDLLADDRRCEAVLKDLCGGDSCRREVYLLMTALRTGIVAQLLSGGNGMPMAAFQSRLIMQLHDELGVEKELAGWSVISWMMALGMMAPEINETPAGTEVTFTKNKPGDVEIVDLGGGEKLELAWCLPGSFMMGSPESEVGRNEDEVQHQVALTTGFWMGKYEITQGQWARLMGKNPAYFKRLRNPVECVSWDECHWFIRKLNEVHGFTIQDLRFRLPTETEWEYACRAGTVEAYAGAIDAMGWYDQNSGNTTHPVGQKRGNAWGLFDMHGNVWEWCQDCYNDLSGTDPGIFVSDSAHVVRGGCWAYGALYCRSANRFGFAQSGWSSSLGFRVVLGGVHEI